MLLVYLHTEQKPNRNTVTYLWPDDMIDVGDSLCNPHYWLEGTVITLML